MNLGRTMVLPNGRILMHVCPEWMKPEARALKDRVRSLIPPWCLDQGGWLSGRSQQKAVAFVAAHPRWLCFDIVACFASIDQERLWRLLRTLDRTLSYDVSRFCVRLGCYEGLPEGTSFSPALANLYLSSVDQRWPGRAIRVADNWASSDRKHLRFELLDLGLATKKRPNFIGKEAIVTLAA